MWPFFEFAGIYFPVYNVAAVLGILAGVTQLFFAARRKRVMLQFFADNFIVLVSVTFFCARLAEILLRNLSLLDFPFVWGSSAGLNFFGGALGFFITLAILARKYNENFFTWLDLSMLATAPALFFHHIGTFFAGSEYGTATALPWGVTFTNPDAVGYSTIPIHPTQIYAALAVLGLFTAASFIFKTTARPGKAGTFLLLTLSITYFFLDFLRGDSAPTFGFFRASQYFAFVFAIVAILLVIKMKQAARDERHGELSIKTQA
ncbi:MAG: prolipoprotein diacylglyceryl transferase [Candidatus Peribacteraceae bacterium]|nr:prolipoprotein diacylglyceryl transferase [Candidatus Peribacteraceae bacterium]